MNQAHGRRSCARARVHPCQRAFIHQKEVGVFVGPLSKYGETKTKKGDAVNQTESLFRTKTHTPIAQRDRALPSEGKGHTFESCRVRHSFQ
jgi:hypothetical protein